MKALVEIAMQCYRNPGAKIYSGRQHGERVREILDLNEKDWDTVNYALAFPEDTVAINPSYFCGLFEESILRLGAEGFRGKYQFCYEGGQDLNKVLQADVDEAIQDVLR